MFTLKQTKLQLLNSIKFMPIINEQAWNAYVEINKDDFSKVCVDIARIVMERLDEEPKPLHGWVRVMSFICMACEEINVGDINSFQLGYIVSIVRLVHSRGEEFWEAYSQNN